MGCISASQKYVLVNNEIFLTPISDSSEKSKTESNENKNKNNLNYNKKYRITSNL